MAVARRSYDAGQVERLGVRDESGRVTFILPYRPPYDWTRMHAWLSARALAGVEQLRTDGYRRTGTVDGVAAIVDVTHLPDQASVLVDVTPASSADPTSVLARVVRVFDLDRDLEAMQMHLETDPWLATMLVRHPGLRVPGGWEPFELAARAVLGQQVTVAAARGLVSALVDLCGERLPHALRSDGLTRLFPTAPAVAAADLSHLRMPGARRATLAALAQAATINRQLLSPGQPLDVSVARLRSIRGIGEWTAQYIALRALRAPDAFPASDVGLLRGAGRHLSSRPSPGELLARAERWRPYRAYAAQVLWAEDDAA